MGVVPEWEPIPRPGGHEWEIRRIRDHEGSVGEPTRFGAVRVTDRGWIADALDGRSYGPFRSMGEAAYPLALAADGQDALLLLGAPLPPPGRRPVRAPAVAVPAPVTHGRRDRLLAVALVALVVLATVAERRRRRR